MGAVAVAAAFAIFAAQSLSSSGAIDLTRSMYLTPRLNWLGASAGGLLFGAGMVYAGGCASRNLVRAGAGDLRALVVLLVLAVAAFAALSGVVGPLRAALEAATAVPLEQFGLASQSLNAITSVLGVPPAISSWLAPLLVAAPIAGFAIVYCRTHTDKLSLLGGVGIGTLVALGWLATAFAYNEMDVSPLTPASLSFVRRRYRRLDRARHCSWPSRIWRRDSLRHFDRQPFERTHLRTIPASGVRRC
jgi:uncharacterized protein